VIVAKTNTPKNEDLRPKAASPAIISLYLPGSEFSFARTKTFVLSGVKVVVTRDAHHQIIEIERGDYGKHYAIVNTYSLKNL